VAENVGNIERGMNHCVQRLIGVVYRAQGAEQPFGPALGIGFFLVRPIIVILSVIGFIFRCQSEPGKDRITLVKALHRSGQVSRCSHQGLLVWTGRYEKQKHQTDENGENHIR